MQLPAVRPIKLKKLSAPKKTVNRAYGGARCHKCLRQRCDEMLVCQLKNYCSNFNLQDNTCISNRRAEDCSQSIESSQGTEIDVFQCTIIIMVQYQTIIHGCGFFFNNYCGRGDWIKSVALATIIAMDAEYLQRTVGSSLARGLAEVSSVRPSDPIEYLASWLLKHRANLKERGAEPDDVTVTLTGTSADHAQVRQ